MIVKTYDEIERDPEYDKYNNSEKVMENYGLLIQYAGGLGVTASTYRQFIALLTAVKGNLEGKTILDLGCGSKESPDALPRSGPYYGLHPGLCRFLHSRGIKVIGIDKADNSKESFENYSVNLIDPHALDFLPNNSVDVVNSRALIDSPTLLKGTAKVTSERGIIFPYNREDLIPNLKKQLERIVRPEGFFIYGGIDS